MSVINQMLKDLEQRSPEASTQSSQQTNMSVPQSSVKIVFITTIAVLVLCSLAFYVWQLNSENNALRAQKNIQASANLSSGLSPDLSSDLSPDLSSDLMAKPSTIIKVNDQQPEVKKTLETQIASISQVSEPTEKTIENLNPVPQVDKVVKYVSNNSSFNDAPKITGNDGSSNLTPVKRDTLATRSDDHIHEDGTKQSHSHKKPEEGEIKKTAQPKSRPKNNINKMSVSRRQLSADELAAQKLELAEKALASNQIEKAEKLLEDVIILKPSDSQTRKKLAALWFGRQAYQNAVNLLSQGISLDRQDSSLREMQARIYLQQGQVTSALNSLKPLADFEDEQYQIMLANVAQQAKQNNVAVNAYKMLITMQPELGRWHMALAVLYDKSSQFTLAGISYKKALTKNDLSVSSENFVKQRIQALGQ